MQITNIRMVPLRDGLRIPWGILIVDTDSDIRGIGEVGGLWGNQDIEAKHSHVNKFKDLFIGENPLRIENIRTKIQDTLWGQSRLNYALLSGLEIACWDISGKKHNIPVSGLLGGRIWEKIRTYANGWYAGLSDPEEFAIGAEKVKSRGYDALKFTPFEKGFRTIDNRELTKVEKRVEAIRESVGPNFDIIIEGHARLSPTDAIRVGRRLEKYDLKWYEAPILSHQGPKTFREMREALDTPIGDDLASIESKYDAFDFIADRSIDIIQPDPGNAGGLRECQIIGQMADAASIGFAPHCSSGPVSLCACVHLDAVLPNFILQENFMEFAYPNWVEDVFDIPLEVHQGRVDIPERPGLGIEIDIECALTHSDDRISGQESEALPELKNKQWARDKPPGWILET